MNQADLYVTFNIIIVIDINDNKPCHYYRFAPEVTVDVEITPTSRVLPMV